MSSSTSSGIPRPLHFVIVTVPRFIIGSAILVSIGINFANVIGRYVFLSPIIWAGEIMIYIMIWTVFVGVILVTFEGQNLKMDFFSIMLPSPFREIINFIATVATMAICVFMIPNDWAVVHLMWVNNQRSVVAEIPMIIPHSALLFGFIGIFVACAVRFRSHVVGNLHSEDRETDEIVAEHGGHHAGEPVQE